MSTAPIFSIAALPEWAAEQCAWQGVAVDRPLDIAPQLGTDLDYGTLAALVEAASDGSTPLVSDRGTGSPFRSATT